MKKASFLSVLLLTLFFACKDSTEQKTTEVSTAPVEKTQAEPTAKDFIWATYESATAYAAATDYVFLAEDGTQILIRVSDVEDAANPEMPEGLLESTENLDGPPGANPAMVGKKFKIEMDADGFYRKVLHENSN